MKAIIVITVDVPPLAECHSYLIANGWQVQEIVQPEPTRTHYTLARLGETFEHHAFLPIKQEKFTSTLFETFVRRMARVDHITESRVYCRIRGLPNI